MRFRWQAPGVAVLRDAVAGPFGPLRVVLGRGAQCGVYIRVRILLGTRSAACVHGVGPRWGGHGWRGGSWALHRVDAWRVGCALQCVCMGRVVVRTRVAACVRGVDLGWGLRLLAPGRAKRGAAE